MSKLVNESTLENAETLTDDMTETQDQMTELNNILSRPLVDMDEVGVWRGKNEPGHCVLFCVVWLQDDLMQELDELDELELELAQVDISKDLKKSQVEEKKRAKIDFPEVCFTS